MNPPHLLELAKQGNIDAIAALLSRSLGAKGIQTAVRCQNRCLEIGLAAAQLPPQSLLVTCICKGLKTLELTSIDRVLIQATQTGQVAATWSEEIELAIQKQNIDIIVESLTEATSVSSGNLSQSLPGKWAGQHKRAAQPSTPIRWPPSPAPIPQPRQTSRLSRDRKRRSRRFPSSLPKPYKKPWLAVNLSMLWPGLGQTYAGAALKGLAFGVMQMTAIAIALWSIFSADGNTVFGLSLFPIALGIWGVGMIDAYQSARKFVPPGTERLPRHHKDPWFAVFLSQVLPGLGQLYSEKMLTGAFFLACTILLSSFSSLFPSLLLFPPLVAAVACYHAYVAFPQPRRRSGEIMLAIATAILIVRLTLSYFPTLIDRQVERFIIPSESMLPTLAIEDRIFVSKSTHYSPRAGDIIVFHPTEAAQALETQVSNQSDNFTEEKFYVKRIIGQPGQTVRITQGNVYINEQPLREYYLTEPPLYEWGPETIPPNSYFVLGDNRNRSADSHRWGFLPKENIVGKAYKIYWPPARIAPLP